MNPFWSGNPASIGQQTRAAQIIVMGAPGNGMRSTRRKRKASRKTAARTRRASPAKRATKRGGRRARLVKGSAAAKAYMAKIRRKRR